MSSGDSISQWIHGLKQGDPEAAEQLWGRYFERLVSLARKKLQGTPRRMADEEDVALSAMKSLCLGAQRGRFPLLKDRDNLWPLLVVITSRKAADYVQHQQRKKRGGGAAMQEAADLERLLGNEPTPEFAAQMEEEYQRLLDRLNDQTLCQIAVWKMEGYTNHEIAEKLGVAPRTVARKLELIRKRWLEDGQ